jgi:DNA-binding CsgD family transcriptional regulator
MELLSDGDIALMLRFLHEASEVEGPEVFTEAVLEAFLELIPATFGAACNAFSGAVADVRPDARSVLSFSEIDCDWCSNIQVPWTDEIDEICRQYVACSEPIPPVAPFIGHAIRQSDVLSVREQRRNELLRALEPVTGVEDTLCLWLAPSGEAVQLRRIQFASARRGGSSDRDVRVLELLAPHLTRLYARAAARRAAAHALGVLTPREHEIIRLVANARTNREIARTLWITPNTVRTHLEHIFEKLGVTNRTAAAAVALGQAAAPPPEAALGDGGPSAA